MTNDLDATLTALLAPNNDDADADVFAASVLRRLDRRDAGRTLILGTAGAGGLALFAWQLVARFDALGAALQALVANVLPSAEIAATLLFALLLASMLAGGTGRRSSAH